MPPVGEKMEMFVVSHMISQNCRFWGWRAFGVYAKLCAQPVFICSVLAYLSKKHICCLDCSWWFVWEISGGKMRWWQLDFWDCSLKTTMLKVSLIMAILIQLNPVLVQWRKAGHIWDFLKIRAWIKSLIELKLELKLFCKQPRKL